MHIRNTTVCIARTWWCNERVEGRPVERLLWFSRQGKMKTYIQVELVEININENQGRGGGKTNYEKMQHVCSVASDSL